jgi:hypothetical protein
MVSVGLGGWITGIIGVCNECPAQECDVGLGVGSAGTSEPLHGKVPHVLGHEVIYLPGESKKGLPPSWVIERIFPLTGPPLQVVGILGETVPTHPRSRPEDGPGHSFFFKAGNTLPHFIEVHPHRFTIEGQLIRRGDLEITQRIFRGLLYLGCGGRHGDHGSGG